MMEKYLNINRNNHSIKGKLYYNDMRNIKKIIVFGHGFGGHKDNKAAKRFSETVLSKYKSVAIFVFDWPSHGDDVKKHVLLDDCMTYIDLILEDLQERFHVSDFYYHATSFGGFCILKYISEKNNPFKKIVLRCPSIKLYESFMEDLTPENKKALDRGLDIQLGFDHRISVNQQFFDQLKQTNLSNRDFIEFADDILIIHGTKDEVIPLQEVNEFSENNVIELEVIENADHRFSDYALMGNAIKKTIDFLHL